MIADCLQDAICLCISRLNNTLDKLVLRAWIAWFTNSQSCDLRTCITIKDNVSKFAGCIAHEKITFTHGYMILGTHDDVQKYVAIALNIVHTKLIIVFMVSLFIL